MKHKIFIWLQDWFSINWKNIQKPDFRVHLTTLDNPGWILRINVKNTELENQPFTRIHIQEELEDDWTICLVRKSIFEGACGPRNLPQVLGIFRKWTEENELQLGNESSLRRLEDNIQINSGEESFLWFQNWYAYYCDGDWEDAYGVCIYTTEEPGWHVIIDLDETDLENCIFHKTSLGQLKNENWVFTEVKDNKFLGSCGPKNLFQVIAIFRNWAEGLGQKVDSTRRNFHDQSFLF